MKLDLDRVADALRAAAATWVASGGDPRLTAAALAGLSLALLLRPPRR